MKEYDVVVIGTGTAGQTAAFEISENGYKVAVIEESDEPGGICALYGCQSKKYYYEAAETVARCQHLLGRGIDEVPKSSWSDVLREKNKFTARIPENTVKNIKSSGMDYFEGKAVFTGPLTLEVGDDSIQAGFIVVASGSEPMKLPINGSENMITSNDFLDLDHLPDRLALVGGGFISFEFAHFAARLGSRPGSIHILEAFDRVLKPFDSDMVDQLTAASITDGINIHTNVRINEILKKDDHFQVISENEAIEVDLVVNAAGRRPNIFSLNLETAGIEYSPRGINVDSSMKTSNKNVFAVGDCAASVQLARVADMEAKTAARAILNKLDGEKYKPMDYEVVPAVLFTYPQLGMVGKTEDQLKQENTKYWKSSDIELGWPTYRRLNMRYAAYKILCDDKGLVLGAHFLSDNATGLVNTFAQAMRAGTTVAEIYENHIMAPYPSRESDILYMLSPLVE